LPAGLLRLHLRRWNSTRDAHVRVYARAISLNSALQLRRSSTRKYECRVRRERNPACDGLKAKKTQIDCCACDAQVASNRYCFEPGV